MEDLTYLVALIPALVKKKLTNDFLTLGKQLNIHS